jgi:3'(2'), 5'-bisphosphate nucleotidase
MTAARPALGRGELTRLLAPLAQLASEAGARILQCTAAGLIPRAKPDLSPVTAADEAAETILRAGLARLLPGIPVIAEEAVSRGEETIPGADFFLVDPIDGTRELLAGRSEYTVNVALLVGRLPVLGLIYAPALKALYTAAEGRALRAVLEPGMRFDAGKSVPIHARPRPQRLVAAMSRSHPDPKSEAFLAALTIERRLILGSSLKFARLAEGEADVYARLAPVSEWDVAAGHALLDAAGGRVTAPDGSALAYGRHETGFRIDGFLAWGAPPES